MHCPRVVDRGANAGCFQECAQLIALRMFDDEEVHGVCGAGEEVREGEIDRFQCLQILLRNCQAALVVLLQVSELDQQDRGLHFKSEKTGQALKA